MNANDYRNLMNKIEVSENCKKEIFETMKESRKKINKKRFMPLGVALALLTCTGTAVFAAETGVFSKLTNKKERTVVNDYGNEIKLDKLDKTNYEKIDENAEKVENLSYQSEYLSLDVESVYCDGTSLIIGLSGTLNIDSPKPVIYFRTQADVNGEHFDDTLINAYEGKCLRMFSDMVIDEGSENTFTGSISMTFAEDFKLTEPTTIDLKLSNIQNTIFGSDYPIKLDDIVEFTLDVTPDLSKVTEVDESVSDEDFVFKIDNISPAMITVEAEWPEFYETNTETIEIIEGDQILHGPKYSIVVLFKDADGNRIDAIDWFDGYLNTIKLGLAYTDTESITAVFINKQESDENGNPKVLKEITVPTCE